MTEEKKVKCAFCGEDLGTNPIYRGEKAYCCEACAYEAKRAVDCGGRADTVIAGPVVEPRPRDK